MVLPVGIMLIAGLVLYAGLNDMSISDALRKAMGRPPQDGALGELSGVPQISSIGTAPSVSGGGSGSSSGVVAAALAAVARQKANHNAYHYSQVRPMAKALFSNRPIYCDCSAFATLVYKYAGMQDPNGMGYDGSGYTGTMQQHGIKVSSPSPGDLAIYPDHVVVCIGNDHCVSMGTEGDPSMLPLSDFSSMGPPTYRTYTAKATTASNPGGVQTGPSLGGHRVTSIG